MPDASPFQEPKGDPEDPEGEISQVVTQPVLDRFYSCQPGVWNKDDDVPGLYRVLVDNLVIAPRLEIRGRPETDRARLPAGTIVKVVEVVHLKDGERVRGRVEAPAGWLSILDIMGGTRWAQGGHKADATINHAWGQHRRIQAYAERWHRISDGLFGLSVAFNFVAIPLSIHLTLIVLKGKPKETHLTLGDHSVEVWPVHWQVIKIILVILAFFSWLLVATKTHYKSEKKRSAGSQQAASIISEIYRYRMHVGAYRKGSSDGPELFGEKIIEFVAEAVAVGMGPALPGDVQQLNDAELVAHMHAKVVHQYHFEEHPPKVPLAVPLLHSVIGLDRPRDVEQANGSDAVTEGDEVDDFTRDLTREAYIKFRLMPLLRQFAFEERRWHMYSRLLQIVLVLSSAMAVIFGMTGDQAWTPFAVGFSSACGLWSSYADVRPKAVSAEDSHHHLEDLVEELASKDDDALVDTTEGVALSWVQDRSHY